MLLSVVEGWHKVRVDAVIRANQGVGFRGYVLESTCREVFAASLFEVEWFQPNITDLIGLANLRAFFEAAFQTYDLTGLMNQTGKTLFDLVIGALVLADVSVRRHKNGREIRWLRFAPYPRPTDSPSTPSPSYLGESELVANKMLTRQLARRPGDYLRETFRESFKANDSIIRMPRTEPTTPPLPYTRELDIDFEDDE